ncbi:hypothetical protein OG985_32355 [Streptomyces sp. NBC_00289]|uniref:hypothetical protein n=1 Tax=Streptomyces sp. NBC_00289 TaxID=2975703 RepID=UPI0032469D6D
MKADPLALLHADAAGLGIDLTPDLLGQVVDAFGAGLFARLLDPREAATAVADIWNAAYNKLDFDSAVIVCLAVRRVLAPGASRLQPHLGNLRWRATWCHVHLYLAGSLYQQAKELMAHGAGDLVRPMLTEALRCWDVVEPNDGHLADRTPGRIWRGMRGVTRLVLARQDPEPLALLRGARVDLRLAEERGDTSEEHFAFLLEVHYRLSQHPEEPRTIWDEVDQLVERARPYVSDSFSWLSVLGEAHLRKAQSVVHGEDEKAADDTDATVDLGPGPRPELPGDEAVVARRKAALDAYREALRLFRSAQERVNGSEHGFRLVMLRHNHGVARAGIARTLQALREMDEVRDLYSAALDDFRWSARHDTPVRGSAYPSALIDCALHLYRSRDFAGAHAVAEEAYFLCEATPDLLANPARQKFLVELWRAAALRGLWPWTETAPDELPEPDPVSAPLPADVRTRLDALLAVQPDELMSAVPLVLSAWLLIERAEPLVDLPRIRATLATLHTLRERATTDTRSWLSARLGMLCGQLDRLCRITSGPATDDTTGPTRNTDGLALEAPARENLLARAYAYFGDAVAETTERRRQLEFGLGRATLHHAKALLAEEGESETAVQLLHEARDVLTACLDEPTDGPPAVSGKPVERPLVRERVTSYLGETCLRLHALTRDEAHLRGAVEWFEQTIAANETMGNVQGMLGDAYLRLARTGSKDDLRTALALKAKARAGGDRSRENFSVSAAGHHRLWRLTQDPEEFATAVGLALRARGLAADWPWPLLQLADLAGAPAAVRATPQLSWEAEEAETYGAAHAESQRLLEAVRNGDQTRLHEQAARTAVHSRTFRQAVLGGRSETFVLDDPHRLLSTTLVLKPTYLAEAEAERAHLESLRQYLRDTAAPRWMRLPEVLALVDLPHDWASTRRPPPDTALASRRAVGRSLAGAIADAYDGRRRLPYEMLVCALRYLARIHVWSSGVTGIAHTGSTHRAHARVAAELEKRAGRLQIPGARDLVEQWEAVAVPSLPFLPGRDAHAENWLVTDSGDVVALDLEPHGHFPLLYEVVQLIEDHAALPLKDSDWPDREALCRVYLDELAALGHTDTMSGPDVLPAYQAFALVRAVFLVEHLSGRPSDGKPKPSSASTGSRRWARRRLAHSHALLERCATTATEEGLRDLALRLETFLPADDTGDVLVGA